MYLKNLLVSVFVLLFTFVAFSQFEGSWKGNLKVQGTELPLVFHITKTSNGFSTKMDSPNQGATGISADNTTTAKNQITIALSKLGITYVGTISSDKKEIAGLFEQANMKFPLTLKKVEAEEKKVGRIQDPKPPLPYTSEEVTFINKEANIRLSGTLTKPNGCANCPAVVLVSGSGQQDRNSEIFNHRPFWVLADFLTKNKIAVLRYDDRGYGKSEGNFATATTNDFAKDAEAAIAYLKTVDKIDTNKIGIIGHSEGGSVAFKLAGARKVAFMVSMAGPALPGAHIIKEQQLSQIENVSLDSTQNADLQGFIKQQMDILLKNNSRVETKAALEKFYKKNFKKLPPAARNMGLKKYTETQVKAFSTPWVQEFLRYDPRADMTEIVCPVLAINGAKDTQVNAEENITRIKETLEEAGNKDVQTEILPNLNHLFQPCESGAVMEYGQIETTIDMQVLQLISSWIVKKTYNE